MVYYHKVPSNLAGRHVMVQGTLYAAHTAHHYTPVLLTVESTTPDKPRE